MRTVLITGGIGAGKSAVSAYLRGRGVPVYEADRAVKRLYLEAPALRKGIRERLGVEILKDGVLDREGLAAVIFSDRKKLETLEAMVHPLLAEDFIRWRGRQGAQWCGYCGDFPFVCIESAVMAEKPAFDGMYDEILFVDAPPEVRLARVLARDGGGEERIAARMRRQGSCRERAAAVVENDGGPEELPARTDAAFRRLTARWKGGDPAAAGKN